MIDGEQTFLKKAMKNDPVMDKVPSGGGGHSYHKMYGAILLPMIEKFNYAKKKLKFLEIGLGCDMVYGPGVSIKFWKQLFEGRDVDLWEAEFDAECVAKAREQGMLEGFSTVTGDQADPGVLKKWIEQSGGKFDVIVDDGGHINRQVLASFVALWPELNPDGNYFIEDLQIAFKPHYYEKEFPAVTRVIQAWVEALHIGPENVTDHRKQLLNQYPLPEGVDSIYCQKEACALHKAAVYSVV